MKYGILAPFLPHQRLKITITSVPFVSTNDARQNTALSANWEVLTNL